MSEILTMRMREAIVSMILVLACGNFCPTAQADSFPLTVGDDANCQFRNVQAAMDAVNGDYDYIKVQKGMRSSRVTVPSRVHFVMIVGGFANCDDEVPSTDLGNNPSIIDGAIGDAGNSAISVAGDTTLLVLRNLVITGARNPRDGGGIYMSTGNCPNQLCGLQIDNVRINGNSASNSGGGIYLYGSPNAAEPTVLQINGAQLALNSAPYGGAINLGGKVAVDIYNTAILANSAKFGGGINADFAEHTARDADLILHANVLLQDNQATTNDGGGMRIAGRTRLLAVEDQISFYGNVATGWGGALDVRGPAFATLGSAGYRPFGGAPMFYANRATNGGALAIRGVGGDDGRAVARSEYGVYPVEFQNNIATNVGGAVYLRPANDASAASDASFIARDFYFRSNVAADGAVVFADRDSFLGVHDGSRVELLPSTRCPRNTTCNRIDGNFVGTFGADGVFSRTEGALLTSVSSTIITYAARFSGNAVGRVFSVVADEGSIVSRSNLIDGNDVLLDVARSVDAAYLEFDSCTIADNAIGTDHVLSVGGSRTASLKYSIVAQPQNTFSGDPARLDGQYNFVPETGSFRGDFTNSTADPMFMDRVNGDYRLANASTAIDYAPFRDNDVDNGVDLEGRPRTRNLGAPNNVIPRDAGAYERPDRQFTDALFTSGFEN